MKKTFKKIASFLEVVLIVISVCAMIFTIISATTLNRYDRNVFGYKFFIVLSDSMKKTDFAAGDVIVVKQVDTATLNEGDVVSYLSQNQNNFGEIVTHKIRSINNSTENGRTFITYGTTNNVDDELPVEESNIIGKYVHHFAGVGKLFNFIKTTPGYICCILLPFLILIVWQGVNTIHLFREYKREQTKLIDDERKAVENEREEQEQMKKEIEALRAQLEKKDKDTKTSSTTN